MIILCTLSFLKDIPLQSLKDSAYRASQVTILSAQITVHGLPIRPAFSKKLAPKHQLRRSLGLERDLPIVLLVGECLHPSTQSQQSSYPENVKMSQGTLSAW